MNACTTAEPNRAIVLYDGSCRFCLKSVALLKKLDWLQRFSYHDARDVENLPQSALPLNPERLLHEMHLLTPDRQKQFTGFRAWRWIAGRLPSMWLVWPLLYVPGAAWLGQRIYRSVARNRFNLVPCRDGECAIGPRSPNREK